MEIGSFVQVLYNQYEVEYYQRQINEWNDDMINVSKFEYHFSISCNIQLQVC